MKTDGVESSWAPGSGARLLAGLLALAAALALVAVSGFRDRVAARAIDDPCDHYLVWVRYRDEPLVSHLAASRDVRSRFCRHAGITGSEIDATNPDASPVIGSRNGKWHNDEYFNQRLEGDSPIPIVPLEPDYVEAGYQTPFRRWYLEVPSGKHALIDTGARDTVLSLGELSGTADITLGRSFIHGWSVVRGRYQDVPLPGGHAWLRQVFATEDDVAGAIGVSLFSDTAEFCMDFEEQLLRFGCDLERSAERIDFVPAHGGGYLVRVEVRGLVSPTFGLIDTGTDVTAILWSGCTMADRFTWTLADPRNDGRPTEIPVQMIHPDLRVGGGRITAERSFVHCVRSWHERPLVLLGMSFLNRFSAIGFDHERREIAFYD
jgi:hypothetical protein